MKKPILTILLLTISLIIAGCGGGGGTSTKVSGKAKTSLKTSGLLGANTYVTSLDVVIAIPYGVTVPLDPLTNEPLKSVVQLVGTFDPNMILSALKYTPATPTAKGSLGITYDKVDGFSFSDYLDIQLDISNGFFPTAADFSLIKFEYSTITIDPVTMVIIDSTASMPVPNPIFTATIQ